MNIENFEVALAAARNHPLSNRVALVAHLSSARFDDSPVVVMANGTYHVVKGVSIENPHTRKEHIILFTEVP